MVSNIIVKKNSDLQAFQTPCCGEMREILSLYDYPATGVSIAVDIKPTTAHYHKTFDEIHFLLDGTITLEFFDPQQNLFQSITLMPNELCIISKGIHHRIVQVSEKNRLCLISHPAFHSDDEYPSDKFENVSRG